MLKVRHGLKCFGGSGQRHSSPCRLEPCVITLVKQVEISLVYLKLAICMESYREIMCFSTVYISCYWHKGQIIRWCKWALLHWFQQSCAHYLSRECGPITSWLIAWIELRTLEKRHYVAVRLITYITVFKTLASLFWNILTAWERGFGCRWKIAI